MSHGNLDANMALAKCQRVSNSKCCVGLRELVPERNGAISDFMGVVYVENYIDILCICM